MNDRQLFERGMKALAANFNRALEPELIGLYWKSLTDLTDVEFASAVKLAIDTELFWPPVAKLKALAQPTSPRYKAEAAAMVEEVTKLEKYHPVMGETVSARAVLDTLGPVAHEAFIAAGGTAAWVNRLANGGHEFIFTRKAFIEAYEQAALARDKDGRLAGVQARLGAKTTGQAIVIQTLAALKLRDGDVTP